MMSDSYGAPQAGGLLPSVEPVPGSPLRAAIPSADEARIEYRFMRAPWNKERHDWIIASEIGAVNVWAEAQGLVLHGREWFGGIEAHYPHAPDYMDERAPSHDRCWLLDAPCWHDGSSLQFSEQVAPFLPSPTGGPMESRILDYVMPILRDRYTHWFASAIEARQGGDGEAGSVHESAAPQADAQPQEPTP